MTPGPPPRDHGQATAGQAALKLAFENWLGGEGYDEDGMFDVDEMEVAFEAGAEAERDLAAQQPQPAPELAKLREQLTASARIVRDILESLCRRDGLSLDSTIVPGEPARNYALAGRLGIGHVFGLNDPTAPEVAARPKLPLLADLLDERDAAIASREQAKADWREVRAERDEAQRERETCRELLDEIGVMAANAPEGGDSFGLLEEIAMRIAAVDVPDSTPLEGQ